MRGKFIQATTCITFIFAVRVASGFPSLQSWQILSKTNAFGYIKSRFTLYFSLLLGLPKEGFHMRALLLDRNTFPNTSR